MNEFDRAMFYAIILILKAVGLILAKQFSGATSESAPYKLTEAMAEHIKKMEGL